MEKHFLFLFISLRCTHSCTHCGYGCSPNRGEDMSWQVFLKSIKIAKKHGIKNLVFYGGEPTINPNFFSMLETVLMQDFFAFLLTNGFIFSNEKILNRFIKKFRKRKDAMAINISNDKFHRKFFDPKVVINKLREIFKVEEVTYSDYKIALTDLNVSMLPKLKNLDFEEFNCCNYGKVNNIGILPDGSWTVCFPYIKPFGNINTHTLQQILDFKSKLKIQCHNGCTRCLKDFDKFHRQFYKDKDSNIIVAR